MTQPDVRVLPKGLTPEQETAQVWSPALRWLQTTCDYQDVAMGGGYLPTRDSVRMAIGSIEDELCELKDAWRAERDGGSQPHLTCGPTCHDTHAWRNTREEAIQVAAIALRLVRDLLEVE